MANTTNTIILQCNSLGEKYEERFTVAATKTVKPGQLIEQVGGARTVQPHASANTFGDHLVALPNYLEGKTVSDSYAAGETVMAFRAQVGDKLYMRLAASMTVPPGAHLSSNGDGALRLTTGTNIALFKSDETSTVTTTGSEDWIKVRTLVTGPPIAQSTTTTTTTTTP